MINPVGQAHERAILSPPTLLFCSITSRYLIIMAPIAISDTFTDIVQPKKDNIGLPAAARERLQKAGVDLSDGYP